MRKKAIVTNIVDSKARVSIIPDDCIKKSACKGCGMCGKDTSKESLLSLEVEKTTGVEVGDVVDVDVSSPRDSVIALVIYMMPLILMFVGGAVGNMHSANVGLVVGGVLGLGISLFIIYLLNATILKLNGKIISV